MRTLSAKNEHDGSGFSVHWISRLVSDSTPRDMAEDEERERMNGCECAHGRNDRCRAHSDLCCITRTSRTVARAAQKDREASVEREYGVVCICYRLVSLPGRKARRLQGEKRWCAPFSGSYFPPFCTTSANDGMSVCAFLSVWMCVFLNASKVECPVKLPMRCGAVESILGGE